LAQAGYIYPNTKLDIETHLHLRSDPTAQPFDISFNPNPTSHHCCPYTTIGADITITGTTPPPKRQTSSEDIFQTITANADHHLQMHERRKLGRTTKPATPTTPPVHGDEVIGKLYNKNMVLIPITIDPFARFGPMFQSFLTSTESSPQEPWFTTHRNNKFNRPYANLMYSGLHDKNGYRSPGTKKTYVDGTKYVRRNTPATASSRQPQTTNKRTMAVASGFCGF
jgi:hypothetical protein